MNAHLSHFFQEISNAGFWRRLFGWTSIRNLSLDAYKEASELEERTVELEAQLKELQNRAQVAGRDLDHEKENRAKLEAELSLLRTSRDEYLRYKQAESERKAAYERNVIELNKVKNLLEKDRETLRREREEEIRAGFEAMKATWNRHEEMVASTIQAICQRHVIEYVQTVPFRGSPDNAIKICDEYIIFDAKSPSTDDLNYFPTYLKSQVEAMRKYLQPGVKKDFFLVIPANTLDQIPRFTYNLADYNVYIISADALEPVVMSLKKIEEYEFAEQLSPDDRDNICRLLGKFAHTTKRKIQVDQYFTWQFLEILTKCKSDLPDEILKLVIAKELSS